MVVDFEQQTGRWEQGTLDWKSLEWVEECMR